MGILNKILFLLLLPTALFLFPGRKAHALDVKNIFQNDYLQVERILHYYAMVKPVKFFAAEKEISLTKKILKDPEKRVRADFKITPFFKSNVHFWFAIYSQFGAHQAVVHDKNRLDLIYDVIDFNELKKSPLNPYLKAELREQFVKEKILILKKTMDYLGRYPNPLGEESKKILGLVKDQGFLIPRNPKKRKKFFQGLSDNIRVQTGQQDMIFQGIINSLPYLAFIRKIQKLFKLPEELLAVGFLESSFNIHARSKVGAAGIWQFMESTGGSVLPMEKKTLDGRLGPLLPTLGALHLLKENFIILKRWDLAVTAYNSGTKHLQIGRKKLGRKEPSLENIFMNYKHPHLGFASKNFYSEFLALVHVLAYKEKLFPFTGIDLKFLRGDHETLRDDFNFYLSLCDFVPDRIHQLLKDKNSDFPILNKHLLIPGKIYGRGTPLMARGTLPPQEFYLLSSEEIRKNFPKNWPKLIKNKICGK